MNVECTKFKSCVKGPLQGFAHLKIVDLGLEIYSCTVWQKNGKRWVKMPEKEYIDSVGEKKYFPHCRFNTMPMHEEFSNAAIKAIDNFCKQNALKVEYDEECPF